MKKSTTTEKQNWSNCDVRYVVVCTSACICVGGCVCGWVGGLTVQVSHIVEGMYVGNTVCTLGADEREKVGVQEVRNKRKHTM